MAFTQKMVGLGTGRWGWWGWRLGMRAGTFDNRDPESRKVSIGICVLGPGPRTQRLSSLLSDGQ